MRKIKTLDVTCPKCGARPSRFCTSSRISSANSYGGGWGGYAVLDRSHPERVALRRERQARS